MRVQTCPSQLATNTDMQEGGGGEVNVFLWLLILLTNWVEVVFYSDCDSDREREEEGGG
jgi:hypothetical protein